jgi:hypothetical protein
MVKSLRAPFTGSIAFFHRDDKAVAGRTTDVVALERGGRRQYDIRMPCRCRLPRLVHDDRFRSTPCAAQPVEILMMMKRIAAGPIDQTDVGIAGLSSIEIIAAARTQ